VSRRSNYLFWGLIGFALGALLIWGAVNLLTRSRFGAEFVRKQALSWLESRVVGKVTVERITSRGLQEGLTLHKFRIVGPEGRLFVEADSVQARYRLRTLISGRIELRHVELFNPVVIIEQLPGDTLWNYQMIFPPGEQIPGQEGKRRYIAFEDVEVHNGTAYVRTPYRPKGPIEPQDTARLILERYPRGLARVMHFDSINALLPRVVWESPIERGKLFTVQRASAKAYIYEDPALVRDLQGTLAIRDSITALRFERVELPSSRAAVVGEVVRVEGANRFDLTVDGRQLVFRDLQWAYPNLPDEGNATMNVRIQSQRPKGLLVYATDARITAPGTRMAGSFGIVTGDTLYFTNVNLRASPLNLDLLESVLPGKLPIQGLLVGTVEVTGPLSSLETSGDVQLTPRGGGKASAVRWAGVFDARSADRISTRNFRADLRNLDLAVINALRPELALRGVVNGRVQANGRLDRRLSFVAALRHELAGLSSQFDGSGSFDASTSELDLTLNAQPLTFSELAAAYPALEILAGEARGPIRMRGRLDDLAVEATLATDGGDIDLKGRLQQNGGRRRYSGEGRATGFHLDRLLPDLPSITLSGTLGFDLTGTSTADANGTVRFTLPSARVQGIDLQDATLEGRVADGLLTVDTAHATTLVGELGAKGAIGITPMRLGTLGFRLHTDSLALDRVTTSGRVDLTGTLTGGFDQFDIDAEAAVARLLLGRVAARRGNWRITGRGLGGDSATLRISGGLEQITAFDEPLEAGTLDFDWRNARGNFTLDAHNRTRRYRLGGEVHQEEGELGARIARLDVGERDRPWQLTSPFNLRVHEGAIVTDSFDIRRGDSGSIRGGGTLAWGTSPDTAHVNGGLDFRLAFQKIPLNEAVRIGLGRSSTQASVDGSIHVTGLAASPLIDAQLDLTDIRLVDARVDRISGSATYANRELNVRVLGEQGPRRVLLGDGRIPLDLSFTNVPERRLPDPLQVSIETDSLPAAILTGLIGGFESVRGTVLGNILLRGTTQAPIIGGGLTLHNAGGVFAPTGVRYRDVNGSFRVTDDSTVAVDLAARAGAGRGTVKGTLVFVPLTDPRLALELVMNGFEAANRRDIELTTSGWVRVEGSYRGPRMSGRVGVDGGTLYLDELYRRYQVVDLTSDLFSTVVDTTLVAIRQIIPESANPFLRNLKVQNLTVSVDRGSWLRSRNLNVEVSGELDVLFDRRSDGRYGSAEDVRILGTLDAVRGTYEMEYTAFTRRFDIREGTVIFPGTPGLDPNLNFTAQYRVRPLQGDPIDVQAVVSGTLLAPRVRLSSEDPLYSESDLASYLFFGVPSTALSTSQSSTVSAFGQQNSALMGLASNALTTSSLGFLASGLQNVAQEFGLLDYVSLTAAETAGPGINTNSALASLFGTTQIQLGRYLRPDLFFVYSNRLGSNYAKDGSVRLEWRFHPTFTAEAFWEDRFARDPGFGFESTYRSRRVLGFFLFREWSF